MFPSLSNLNFYFVFLSYQVLFLRGRGGPGLTTGLLICGEGAPRIFCPFWGWLVMASWFCKAARWAEAIASADGVCIGWLRWGGGPWGRLVGGRIGRICPWLLGIRGLKISLDSIRAGSKNNFNRKSHYKSNFHSSLANYLPKRSILSRVNPERIFTKVNAWTFQRSPRTVFI